MLKYRICFFSPYECTLKTTYCMLQSQSIGYTIREAESGRTPMRREKGCMAIKWRSGGQKEMDERNSCLWQRLADRGRRTGQASVGGRGGGSAFDVGVQIRDNINRGYTTVLSGWAAVHHSDDKCRWSQGFYRGSFKRVQQQRSAQHSPPVDLLEDTLRSGIEPNYVLPKTFFVAGVKHGGEQVTFSPVKFVTKHE